MPVAHPSPSDRLLALFVPWMAARGFAYRKTGHVFRRPFAEGHHAFALRFDGRGGFVTVHAAFAIHFDALTAIQARLGWSTGQAGRALDTMGIQPDCYDLYLSRYMEMTPRQRKGITSETTHPQARIEAGVAFLQEAYVRYAEPAFDALRTERDLAGFYLQCLRDRTRGHRHPAAPAQLERHAMLLATRMDDGGAALMDALARTAPWDVWTRESIATAATALGIEPPASLPPEPRVVPL